MSRIESDTLKSFEDYIPKDHIANVESFLENPEIEVIGVHISPYIPTYRIVGLKIVNEPIGIIVKQSDIPLVRERLTNVARIDSSTINVISNHLSMIEDFFAQAEAALFTVVS